MSRYRTIALAWLLVGAGVIPAAVAQTAERGAGVVSARVYGLSLFGEHCASCHGTSGRGDGPRARSLTVRPRDLTHLAERNGWVFDVAKISRAIAGGDRAHGSEMVRWGETFRTETGDAEAAARLEALALYLEFIQVKPPRR